MYEMVYMSKKDGYKYADRLLTTDLNYAWRLARKIVRDINNFRNKDEQIVLITVQPSTF